MTGCSERNSWFISLQSEQIVLDTSFNCSMHFNPLLNLENSLDCRMIG